MIKYDLYYEYEFVLKNGEKYWYSPIDPNDNIKTEDTFKLVLGDYTFEHKINEVKTIHLTANEDGEELKRELIFNNKNKLEEEY